MDIGIHGKGFYTITAHTPAGTKFMQKVQGNDHGTAYCDDVNYAAAIADAAHDNGLAVWVNGKKYIGNGAVEA